MIARVGIGLLVAGAVALLALRARGLSTNGAITATAIGTAAVAAGWRWAALLLAFFLSSTLLSRYRSATKEARTGAVTAKSGRRDAVQVLANGGLFASAAVLSLVLPWPGWPLAAAGALAAATSDTWATEVGSLASHRPRSIISGQVVEHGTSGGVTLLGIAAALLGAGFTAALVWLVGWPAEFAIGALVGGITGSTADSVLGATMQARRHCPSCGELTERTMHRCGRPTRPAGGLAWLTNDGVNAVCTVTGALVAALWL